jgi:N utilization substance protein A
VGKRVCIHGIVRELGNENIDVINYSNIQLYITRALSRISKRLMKSKLEEVSKAIEEEGTTLN